MHINVDYEEGKDIFSCDVCGKEFRNEGSLAQHRAIHKYNTTCYICGTTLSRVQHYRRHLKNIHQIDPQSLTHFPPPQDLQFDISSELHNPDVD